MTNITTLRFWPGIYPRKYNPIGRRRRSKLSVKRMAVPRIGDSAILICLGKSATNHQIRRDNGHFRSSCR
ncbi:hypothetical protein Bra5_CH04279 [Rhizobium phaseoli Brasil 5]|nr:hypothetical protein Bra5_CH04279 [Rhizobium phaseoli Brasil 5]